jgi:hypothetical protein
MKSKTKLLLIGLMLVGLSGCVTAGGTTSESSARWKNAGIGAAIGCVATGPFCALGIGPVIGAVIGGVKSVEERKEEPEVEQAKLAPIPSSFGERQKNFYK